MDLQEATATVRAAFTWALPLACPGYREATELLAHESVRLIDAEELVRVKPLEWKDTIRGQSCETIFGLVTVDLLPKYWTWQTPGAWFELCDSLEDGKAKAEAWYRQRFAAALEPLFAKEAGK